MAFTEHSPLTPHRRDLCSRSIWLARKIRSDLTALTESYPGEASGPEQEHQPGLCGWDASGKH
nr:ciliary neurotrophic factor [Homo sapiens]